MVNEWRGKKEQRLNRECEDEEEEEEEEDNIYAVVEVRFWNVTYVVISSLNNN